MRSRMWATLVTAPLLLAGSLLAPSTASAAPTGVAAAAAPPVSAAEAPRGSREHRQWVRGLRKLVVATALGREGADYVWGGAGPDTFDCSGLVQWVYQQVTGMVLPHFSGAQMDATTPVTGRLRRGDLLFYGPDGSQHVALYVGRGLQIGANNPRVGVVVEPMASSYWATRYVGAGRVLR